MKCFFGACFFIFCFPISTFGQLLFSNDINGVNPNASNPYTFGQLVNPDITVTGIGRGSGIFGINSNNRYDARSWKSEVLDLNAYFEFTIIPNTDKKINFESFSYTGQTSVNGPALFAFRSSVDNFSSDIGLVTATGSIVSLSAASFQNISSPITFRLYGWAANRGTGTFSVNDFQFNGIVSCATPQTPTLPETTLSCSSTSFELNWPASLHASNYIIDVATDSGFINNLVDYQNKVLGNTLTETVDGLTAGATYYTRLHTSNGCGTSNYSNTIKVAPPETIFNGTWSNGAPEANKNVRFSTDFNVNGYFEACSCQIDDGVAVNVDSGAILKIENGLDVQGTGSLTFENNASLVQVNDDVVNSGKIVFKRNTSAMKASDYTYWSSPVQDQTLNVLSPNTEPNKFYSFANGAWFREEGTNKMNPAGKGFIIRVPKPNINYTNGKDYWTGPSYIQKVAFEGKPNSGLINISVPAADKYNLIGNPYPSAMDADLFITNAINKDLMTGALYFWTHNTAIKDNGSAYVYSSNDYAVYTLTGGTSGTPVKTPAGSGGDAPTGQIAAGVAFFVKSTKAGNFEFNNSMRISNQAANSQFFKQSNTKKTASVEKSRVWLNLSNSDGIFKQTLVGYIAGASNDLDKLYDGATFAGNTYVDFYSINNGKNLVIQGRELPFLPTDKVPLGFKTAIDGAFEIKIDQSDGLLAKCKVYLEDKNTGILHDLKKSSYSFSTLKGEYNDRFVLSYLPNQKTISGDDIIEKTKQQFEIYLQANQLSLKSRVEKISAVFIYDLKGHMIYQKSNINKEQFVISDLIPRRQILIVKTVFENTVSRTDKIIF